MKTKKLKKSIYKPIDD